MKSFVLFSLLLVSTTQAATIAIIDSGVDYRHIHLKKNMWKDSDGKMGWNFAEENSEIFDPSILVTFSPDVKAYSEISAKAMLFSATDAEKTWAREKVKEQGFGEEVMRYGTYVHGTHVAGIAAKGTPHKVIGIKLLSTPSKVAIEDGQKSVKAMRSENLDQRMMLILAKMALKSAEGMKALTTFMANNGAQVANGSFGVGAPQAAQMIDAIFKKIFSRSPADQELIKYTFMFLRLSNEAGTSYVAAAPDTLFVFAAGNDGLSNDTLPATPASIKAPNVISVAATYQDQFFAPFSNYGVTSVDVAAPGMAIKSTIPGDDYLTVSGTSQAAPYVTKVAGFVKDANTALTPAKVKQIIMETVDKKEFLKMRVASGGLVNLERAVFAARLSKTLSLEEAIERSKGAVRARPANKMMMVPKLLDVKPIPMPSFYQ